MLRQKFFALPLFLAIFAILYVELRLYFLENSNENLTDKTRPKVPRNPTIFYNRVPKTASSSFMGICHALTRQNGVHTIHVNVTRNAHVLTLKDRVSLARNATEWEARQPGIFHGHVAFFDFVQYGAERNPIFINLIREPLDRFVSYYYFLRYGDDKRPHLVRSRFGDKETLDDCVKRRGNGCDPGKLWIQVPFFCGQHPDCWLPASKWALRRAKDNILRHYLLVGLTENLLDFVAILEEILPEFFAGATELYLEDHKRSHQRKTRHKVRPSDETIKEIQDWNVYKVERELYDFVKLQFEEISTRMIQARGEGKRPIFKKTEWTFDLLRPSNDE